MPDLPAPPGTGDSWGGALNAAIESIVLAPGTHAQLPSPSNMVTGTLYPCTDHGKLYRFDGAAWTDWATLGSGGLTAEDVRDTVAAFVMAGANITVTHDDVADTLTIASTATGGAGLTAEEVRDTVAAFLVQGSNVTLTHDDAADTLTIASTASGGGGGGTGLFRGQWASSVPTVVQTYDFASGTIPAGWTVDGGTDVAVVAYGTQPGGAIPSPPTNMLRIGAYPSGDDRSVSMPIGVDHPAADRVRFWAGTSLQGDAWGRCEVDLTPASGTQQQGTSPWTQFTATVTGANAVRWRSERIYSGGNNEYYVARIEVIEDVGPNYLAGEFVTHNGKLWKSNSNGNVGEPGVAGWTEVPIYDDSAAVAGLDTRLDALEAVDPVLSVVAGANITVDNTNPQSPVISAAGGADPSGRFRGTWATSSDQVIETYDFSDGALPAGWTSGAGYSIANYSSPWGGAVVPAPAKMVNFNDSGTANITYDVADNSPATKVRFWHTEKLSNGSYDAAQFLVNGSVVMDTYPASPGSPWTQVTYSITPGAVLQWRRTNNSGGQGDDLYSVARIELLETVTNNYLINDLVQHNGSLWRCLVAGTAGEPGVSADWAAVILATRSINAQTGTAYTLVAADAGKLVTLTNAAAITLTVPTNASVALPVGTEINLAQLGAGQVTVAGASGVTVNGSPGTKIAAQYGAATLTKVATDTWLLVGRLAA